MWNQQAKQCQENAAERLRQQEAERAEEAARQNQSWKINQFCAQEHFPSLGASDIFTLTFVSTDLLIFHDL